MKKINLSASKCFLKYLVVLVIKGFSVALILALPMLSVGQQAKSVKQDTFNTAILGGPDGVSGELKNAENIEAVTAGIKARMTYNDWKTKLKENYGLSYGLSAALFYQNANKTLPDYGNNAFGGVYRFYGSWTFVGRGTGHSARLNWRLEYRTKSFGLQVPQDLGNAVGAKALNTARYWSNMSVDLNILSYTQVFNNNRAAFTIGRLVYAEYMDYYRFASFYGPFANAAFFINPTMGTTGLGSLGAVLKGFVTKQVWMGAHIYDANASNGKFDINTIKEGEFLYVGDIGWTPSIDMFKKTSIQLLFWYKDPRKSTGDLRGKGLVFTTYFHSNKWIPFVRWGLSDGGGNVKAKDALSLGFEYALRKDQWFALAGGWAKPSKKTHGADLRDEYVIETSYRMQLMPGLTLMPDVQLLIHPAANPNVNTTWIMGMRFYAHL